MDNVHIATLLSRILVLWPHLEDLMVGVFDRLVGTKPENYENGSLLFYAIVNQKTRIDLMRRLLQRGRSNRNRSSTYDDIIDEFQRLNDLRNRYIHGRWWTHQDGDTYLQVDNSEQPTHVGYRKVTVKELEDFCARCGSLSTTLCFKP